MPTIPVEIICQIIENVKDTDTLRATSLLCSDLQSVAQRGLFNSFTLKPTLDESGIDLLSRLLSSPHIIPYIQTFRLHISCNWNRHWSQLVKHNGHLLIQFLQMIQVENLQQLEIVDPFRVSGIPDEDTVGPRLAASIEKFCGGPSLHTLDITSQPCGLIQQCGPSVKHLVVTRGFPSDVSVLHAGTPASVPLHTLESHYNYDEDSPAIGLYQYLLDPRCCVDLRSLKRLVLSFNSWMGFETVRTVIERCHQTLESLDLTCDENTEGLLFNLHNLVQLRELAFRPNVETDLHDPLVWLSKELDSPLESTSRLETLEVTIDYISDEVRAYTDFQNWETLSNLLANKTRFPHLQSVRLVLSSSYDELIDPDRFGKDIAYALNALSTLGVLKLGWDS